MRTAILICLFSGLIYKLIQIKKINSDIEFLENFKQNLINLNKCFTDKKISDNLEFLEINLYKYCDLVKVKTLCPNSNNFLIAVLVKNFYSIFYNHFGITYKDFFIFSASVVSDTNSAIGELVEKRKKYIVELFPLFYISNFFRATTDFLFNSFSFDNSTSVFSKFFSFFTNLCGVFSFIVVIFPESICYFRKIIFVIFDFF